MVYVPEDFEDYKFVVSYNDNFVVLTNRRSITASWDNVQSLPVVYQYFVPSIYTFTGVSTFSSSRTFDEIEVSSDFYARADCNDIIQSQFLCLAFVLFIVNGFTKLFKRGGIFFGS